MPHARIVQLTDLHLTATPSRRSRGAPVWANLHLALNHLRTELGQVDLVILTGDLAAERSETTYGRLRSALEDWSSSLRVVPGNHDDRAMVRATFADRSAPTTRALCFVTNVGAFRVIGLDTLRRWRGYGVLGDQQRRWLASELRRSEAPTLLFMHHPPIRIGTWWLDKDIVRDRTELRTILGGSRVQGIFCGHVHQTSRGSFAGIPVWTTPSTAYQFPPRALLPRAEQAPPGLRVVDLDGERFETRVVRL